MNATAFVARRAANHLLPTLALFTVLALIASPVQAQVFGLTGPATVLDSGRPAISASALFDDQAWGAMGLFRYGMGSQFDLGFQAAVIAHDDSPGVEGPTTFAASVDAKRQLRTATPDKQIDASFDLALGFEGGSDFSRVVVTPMAIASQRLTYDDMGRSITPYASMGLSYERIRVGGVSDSDVGLEARIGGLWEPSPGFGLTAEFGFGGQNSFLAGARWPF